MDIVPDKVVFDKTASREYLPAGQDTPACPAHTVNEGKVPLNNRFTRTQSGQNFRKNAYLFLD